MAILTTLGGSNFGGPRRRVVDRGARSGRGSADHGDEFVVNIDRVQASSVPWCGLIASAGSYLTLRSSPTTKNISNLVAAAEGLPPDIRAAFENWVVGAGR